MKSLGLVGFGSFGRFMAGHLSPHFKLTVSDLRAPSARALGPRVKAGTLAEAGACDVVMLAVPVQKLDGVLKKIRSHVRPGALVMDVASVKIKPLQWMARRLPRNVDIIGTHPLFGPQSGKKGIAGLPIVLCPGRGKRTPKLASFLSGKLKLTVIRMSPEAHDRRMAYVQGLTHLIGRSTARLGLPEGEPATIAYRHLLALRDLLRHDSNELFDAIEGQNPYAAKVRKSFTAALNRLNRRW